MSNKLELTTSQNRIDALIGSAAMPTGDNWKVAAHVIDGILENEDLNLGGTFADWSAKVALEMYADETFLERTEIDSEEIGFDAVRNAVDAALTKMQVWERLHHFGDEYVAEVFAGEVPGDRDVQVIFTDLGRKRFGVNRDGATLDLDTLSVTWKDSLDRYKESQFAPGQPDAIERGRVWIEQYPVRRVLVALDNAASDRGTNFISVSMNGTDDFYVIEVPTEASEVEIIAAIEVENLEIGGESAPSVFNPWNSVRVYRSGELYLEQIAQPRAA